MGNTFQTLGQEHKHIQERYVDECIDVRPRLAEQCQLGVEGGDI